MQIWVDADACPNVIKEVLFRAADRTGMMVTLVANQPLKTPPSNLSAQCRWLPVLMWLITRLCSGWKKMIW